MRPSTAPWLRAPQLHSGASSKRPTVPATLSGRERPADSLLVHLLPLSHILIPAETDNALYVHIGTAGILISGY